MEEPGLPAEDRTRLAGVIYEEAKAASLDPFFVLAVIAVESGFDNEAESSAALGFVSSIGARPSDLRKETICHRCCSG